MDGISPTPQPPQQQTNIFLIGGLIGVLLLFLLLILNYFNILSLSRLFPNQLGFLPHREQNNRPISQPTHSPTNYSPNTFQYDTKKAKKILTQYIKENIKSEFLPQNLEIKQGLYIDNKVSSLKNMFGSYFSKNNAIISINFHYKENTNNPNDFFIFIQLTKLEKVTLTPDIANSLSSSYFINPYSPITNCDIKGTTSYCETFKIEKDGKIGFGAIIAQDPSKSPPKLTSIVFTCFIPKESKDYDTTQSCISP